MGVNVKTGIIVASYAHVFKPTANDDGSMKFSICALIDKGLKADIKAYEAAIKEAFDEGVAKGYWTKEFWNSPSLKKPLRDGDDEVKSGEKKPNIGYEGRLFFNAYADGNPESEYFSPPEVVKPQGGKVVPIEDRSEFYSGCSCRLGISFYPFKNKSRGIAVGLNSVFKVSDGERLDGREKAADAFSEFAQEMGDVEGEGAEVEDTTEPFDE